MLHIAIFIFFINAHQIIAFKGLWIQNTLCAVCLASWFCLQNVSISFFFFFLKKINDSVFWRKKPKDNSQLTPSTKTSVILFTIALITKDNCHIYVKKKKEVKECPDKWDDFILDLLPFSNKRLCYIYQYNFIQRLKNSIVIKLYAE